ncbi:MAG: NAD(P)H-dependent flavin oxidoreductase [Alphaproteobacteria bacterium]
MVKNHPITEALKNATSLPLFVAPLFLNSTPELVLASVKEGLLPGIPAYGQMTSQGWDDWLTEIEKGIAKLKDENPALSGIYAANLIFKSNKDRIDKDFDIVCKHRVPIVLASSQPTKEQVDKIHAYGGIVFYDVANIEEAKRAIDVGADGMIAITAGAGGQGSTKNPIAFVNEIRQIFDGPLVLAGCLSTGHDILAAQSIGADFATMGTRFVATKEARAEEGYKQMIVDSTASEIIYTSAFTGQPANFMAGSITSSGYDVDKVRREGITAERVRPAPGEKSKSWVKIWAAGQGVGSCHDIPSVAELANRLKREYAEAKQEMAERLGLVTAPANDTRKPSVRHKSMRP